jgi:cysteine desulfurase
MTIPAGLKDGPIYLDYNATTPIDPQVLEAMWPYFQQHFGNPSSTHVYGLAARAGVDRARQQVASLLGSEAKDIIFTGGGSEGDNLAIRGAALAANRGKHIITQVTEHPGTLNICRALSRLHGFQVTILPVDRSGLVDPAAVEAAIMPETCLITIMHANNETGTIQPIAEIARIAHQHGIFMHTDAAQSVGKIPVNVHELDVDLLSFAGHKLYAPKGIGALYVRPGLRMEPLIYGGGQEHGLRAGTENVALMVALGTACQIAQEQMAESPQRLQRLRDLLWQRLNELVNVPLALNGHETQRLPNTLNIRVSGLVGEDILAATPGIASSTGSACHAGNTDPSEVLLALGLERSQALGALRLTLGRWSTEDEIERAARMLAQTIASLL